MNGRDSGGFGLDMTRKCEQSTTIFLCPGDDPTSKKRLTCSVISAKLARLCVGKRETHRPPEYPVTKASLSAERTYPSID